MGERSGEGGGAGRPRFIERRRGARLRVPSLTILWHPEVSRAGERVRLEGLMHGSEVAVTRTGPGFLPPGALRSQPLAHPALDGLRLRFSPGSAFGGVALEVSGNGPPVAADGTLLAEPRQLRAEELEGGVVLEIGDAVVLLLHHLSASEQWEPMDFGLVGDSEALVEVRREIRRVADLEVPILLRGETGTGKELMARAIHRASRRRDHAYQSLNLGAVPPSLAASELFGAAKGSFTGSVRTQIGYFVRAHRGTLFLDEVGEAPPEIQVMLLRVLESGEIQPLGVQETQQVDVRLLAATDLDLESASEEGSFRAPLLHRLAGYEILVPPLRERRDDFGRLFVAFLREELEAVGDADRIGPDRVLQWLPVSIVARLARHDWPGNVRQLKNVARQLAIGSRGADTVRIGPQLERMLQEAVAHNLPSGQAVAPQASAGGRPAGPAPRKEYRDPAEVAEDELVDALRRNRWAVKATATDLGVSRTSLYALIDRSPAIRKAADLSREEIQRVREEHGGDVNAMGEALEVSTAGLQQRMKELGVD
jgi:two-component system nitrogen regulation response regulator GlnG